MEMNTRIQVEHPVTEMITGIDLIKEQIKCAAGNKLRIKQEDLTFKGSAIEIRINAEDPKKDFLPSTGRITHLHLPSGPFIRTDSHIYQGYTIPTLYDSLLAKIIAWGNTREEALSRMACALDEIVIEGIVTNISFQKQILRNPVFKSEKFSTNFLDQEKSYFDNNGSNIALEEEELCAALAVIIPQLGQENKSKAPSYSHPHWLHEARKENIKDQNALGYSLRQS
jgi:acetyl-CoA carboxylase biotin carboxylase subunit